jgi:activator of Hsp90 ATPase-like protein
MASERDEVARDDDVVRITVEVAVDPTAAFMIFTQEIGHWWRPGPLNWNDADHAIGVRIEPGPGGRWIEIHDRRTGEGVTQGRFVKWDLGARLVFLYQDGGHLLDGTEVEIRFAPVVGGTRVTLEHRGWERVAPEAAARARNLKRWGWGNILNWYVDWTFWGSPLRITDQPRL